MKHKVHCEFERLHKHFLLYGISHETAFWLEEIKSEHEIIENINRQLKLKSPSSSQTSTAEILVKVGLLVATLVGRFAEDTCTPFPRDRGATTGFTGIT